MLKSLQTVTLGLTLVAAPALVAIPAGGQGGTSTGGTSAPSAADSSAAGMGGIGQSQTITVRARVRSVDLRTRHVTLVKPDGDVFTVAVSPEVRNLAQVRPGSTVVVHYHTGVVFVLSAPGTPVPPDTLSVAGGRAAPGQQPAGAAGARLVVTGTVVAVDPQHNTISLVDPRGGAVRTLDVTDPRIQSRLSAVKVGDSITAVYTEAVAVAVEPAG